MRNLFNSHEQGLRFKDVLLQAAQSLPQTYHHSWYLHGQMIKPILVPKFQDIKSIIQLIAWDAKQFYENLTSDPDIVNDVDSIDGTLDFTLE